MITNFFKITLPFTEFEVQQLPYTDEKLQELRDDHNHEASFFRDGEHIYISPAKDVSLDLGTPTVIQVAKNPKIVSSLIRHLLFRRFRDAFPKRVPESFAPLRFRSEKPDHDPLHALVPPELQSKIGYPRRIEVHVKTRVVDRSPQFGLLFYTRQRWWLPIPLSQLKKEGFTIEGCTVLETVPIPGLTGILAPDETLVGIVEKLNEKTATVRTNQGLKTFSLQTLYLQRVPEQIGKYLKFKLGESKATEIFEHLRQYEHDRSSPSEYYTEIHKFAKWFVEQAYQNSDGFTFQVTNNCDIGDRCFKLEPTTLVFDHAPGSSAVSPLQGLRNFGPFDSNRFDRKQPRMLVMFNERNRGAATQFVAQLINGISNSRYFKKGLRELFRLHEVDQVLKPLAGTTPEHYERTVDEAIQSAAGDKFDIAIVECSDESYKYPPAHNPYIRAKARLMSYGIPMQCIRESHLRKSKDKLQFTLGPAALQIYAKMGGLPWLLPGSQSVDRELIIGIGHTMERPNLWSGAEQSRIVGLTTFFLGDGRYILGRELRSVPYTQYFATLLQSLEDSLTQVAQEYAWKEGDTVRIVFHVFKPVKNMEADVVEDLIKRFPQYNILFAFVTVSTKHPWFMFKDGHQKKDKWELSICERGDNLPLDEHACLLQLRGNKDRPYKGHRPPYPVLVRLHEKSTYKDLQFICQQLLDFSYLNWRSFFPAQRPVTIFFSELMASLSSRLQEVQGWNPVILDQHFRRKKWFL